MVFSADPELVTTSGSLSIPGEVWTQSTRRMTLKKPVYCSLPDTEFAILLDDLRDKIWCLESGVGKRIGKFHLVQPSYPDQIPKSAPGRATRFEETFDKPESPSSSPKFRVQSEPLIPKSQFQNGEVHVWTLGLNIRRSQSQ